MLRRRVRFLCAAAALAACAILYGRSTAAASAPTLGCPNAPGQKGYGHVRPSVIFNGGDPTGLVTNIHWSTWGGPRAIGRGTGDWGWPGESGARGASETPAVIVAWDRGVCDGHPAYLHVLWYFPSRGDTLHSTLHPPRPHGCGSMTYAGGGRRASD